MKDLLYKIGLPAIVIIASLTFSCKPKKPSVEMQMEKQKALDEIKKNGTGDDWGKHIREIKYTSEIQKLATAVYGNELYVESRKVEDVISMSGEEIDDIRKRLCPLSDHHVPDDKRTEWIILKFETRDFIWYVNYCPYEYDIVEWSDFIRFVPCTIWLPNDKSTPAYISQSEKNSVECVYIRHINYDLDSISKIQYRDYMPPHEIVQEDYE